MFKIYNYLKEILILILLILVISSCSDNGTDPEDDEKERGEIYSAKVVETYTTESITTLVNIVAGTTTLPANFEQVHDVKFVSIEYQTIDYNNNKVKASGALFIPQTEASFPLLSVQHGTLLKRTNAASISPFLVTEGIFGLAMSSLGYITCVPDYLGFGVSEIIHPYVHNKGNSNAVIDFMRAARNYCAQNGIMLNGKIFLSGYSEGGYVTLATQKEIEENYSTEFRLTAVAPMAGPYDLNYTMNWIINKGKYNYPGYISYFLVAYNEIYGWNRLDEFFVSNLSADIRNMFNGELDFQSVNNALPKSIDGLLHSTVINELSNQTDSDLLAKINENSLLDWHPIAPITLFHGNSDNAVHYQNSVNAHEALSARSNSYVNLITIPGGDHESSILPSILGAFEWFESFRQSKVYAKVN